MSELPKKLPRMHQDELNRIMAKHELYRQSRSGGARAVLTHKDMSGLLLRGRDLAHADFTGSIMFECTLEKSILDCCVFFAADLRDSNFCNASLVRADLRGACLRGSIMAGADLTNADLREGSFATFDPDKGLSFVSDGASWAAGSGGVDMRGANLVSAKMSGAIAVNSNFEDANLSKAKITGGDLSGANLAGANLAGTDLSACSLQNVNLRGANLAGALMDFSNLKNVDMTGALTDKPVGKTFDKLPIPLVEWIKLHQVWLKTKGAEGKNLDFSGYDMRSAPSFAGANLTMLVSNNTVWHERDFSDANLQASQFKDCDFRGCTFVNTDLRGSNFSKSNIVSAKFIGARLEPLMLDGVRMMKTNFTDANLRHSDFSKANVSHVDFSRADVSFCNFTGANVTDANFEGARMVETKIKL